MKVTTNEKKAKRNSLIAFWILFCSLLHVIAGAYFLFRLESQLEISLILFMLGFILFQVGKSLNKWRLGTDRILNNALQKLGDDYSIYHFSSPVSHLLIGPAGIWIIVPSFAKGNITYDRRRKRWKIKNPSILHQILSPFTNKIGRPDLEIIGEADTFNRYLQKNWSLNTLPKINAVLIFLSDQAEVSSSKAPTPAMHGSELREFIRKKERENRIPYKTIKTLNTLLMG